jgi:hypothetical protein
MPDREIGLDERIGPGVVVLRGTVQFSYLKEGFVEISARGI